MKIFYEHNKIYWHPKAGKEYLLVAGGREPSTEWLIGAAKNRFVVCADKGVSYCRAAGIRPDFLCGDGDSAGDDWIWAQNEGITIERYSPDKDATDLQLALDFITGQKDCGHLYVTGIWGGRFDHAFSNVFSIAAWSKIYKCPTIMADQLECFIPLVKGQTINVEFSLSPEAISLLPVSQKAVVSLTGVQWPLHEKVLSKTNPYAISNRLAKEQKALVFSVHSGSAGLHVVS